MLSDDTMQINAVKAGMRVEYQLHDFCGNNAWLVGTVEEEVERGMWKVTRERVMHSEMSEANLNRFGKFAGTDIAYAVEMQVMV